MRLLPPKSDPSSSSRSWKELALRKLSRRDFAERELFEALLKLECPDADAARVVQELKAMGYLDDDRLMQAQARSCLASKRGPGALWQRLQRRGIEITRTQAVQLYREAGTSLGGAIQSDESSVLFEEAQRAWRAVRRREKDLWKARQKIAARLIRRGFTPNLVFRACEKLNDST